jgi:hypothetical protein
MRKWIRWSWFIGPETLAGHGSLRIFILRAPSLETMAAGARDTVLPGTTRANRHDRSGHAEGRLGNLTMARMMCWRVRPRNGIARVIAEDAGEVRVLPRLRFRPTQLSTQSRP